MERRSFLSLAAGGLAAAAGSPLFAQTRTLRVGSTPTGVPFTFLDTQTNTIQGIMVDLVTEVGREAGFAVQIEPMQFSALIGALTSNRIDIIAAAMYITPPRQEVVNFSSPIITYGEGLFVPSTDTTEYRTLQDLRGKAVGAQVGTAYVAPLQQSGLFSEVRTFDNIPDIMRDVNAGRLGAGFADQPIVAYNLQLGRFPQVRLVRSYQPTITGSVGLAVRKADTELLASINTALAKLTENGSVRHILGRWGQEQS